jgi:hypothetical protein
LKLTAGIIIQTQYNYDVDPPGFETNWKITEKEELEPYKEYVVVLKTDLFGNWVIARKGKEEVAFRCTDAIFSDLELKKKIGKVDQLDSK